MLLNLGSYLIDLSGNYRMIVNLHSSFGFRAQFPEDYAKPSFIDRRFPIIRPRERKDFGSSFAVFRR
jgi:hypothetical protein